MISLKIVALVSLIYFGILFGVAYFADRQRERGHQHEHQPGKRGAVHHLTRVLRGFALPLKGEGVLG